MNLGPLEEHKFSLLLSLLPNPLWGLVTPEGWKMVMADDANGSNRMELLPLAMSCTECSTEKI